jgi:hypothetical protein
MTNPFKIFVGKLQVMKHLLIKPLIISLHYDDMKCYSCDRTVGETRCKVHPRTGHEGPERDNRYRSTLSLTSTLNGVGSQRYTPAALPPGKDPVPIL